MTTKPVTRMHQYMFEGKPAHSGTWLELTANDKLRVYNISNHVAMLVEPDTGDYCYVYWDEAGQCSNPYRSYDEAAHNSHWGVHVPADCQVVQIINADPFVECCNQITAYERSLIQR